MATILLLVLALIVIALFGGLTYLIYLPIKKSLIRSGKLTDKLSRKIKQSFVLSLCLLSVALYFLKDYRTASKFRLEESSGIKLPPGYEVLKDECEDMWQDYCILYDIKLNDSSCKEIIASIRTSKFYNPNVLRQGIWSDDYYIQVDSTKAAWCRSNRGFDFRREDGRTEYFVTFDTVTKILKFEECAD